MAKTRLVIAALLLLFQSEVSKAELPVLLTKDTNTFANLVDTDLVKKKDFLDCQLRLVGKPRHYKLIYSRGEIEVPTLAVKKGYGDSHRLLAVKANISGLPVSELFVRYQEDINKPYKMELNCRMSPCDAPVAYAMLLDRPEDIVFSTLRSRYPKNLVENSASNGNVNPGAVMIRDRPSIETGAMDGLNGSADKRKTYLHYVCATEK